MNGNLCQLGNAVVNSGREVEVAPEVAIREITAEEAGDQDVETERATKCAPRTFGRSNRLT